MLSWIGRRCAPLWNATSSRERRAAGCLAINLFERVLLPAPAFPRSIVVTALFLPRYNVYAQPPRVCAVGCSGLLATLLLPLRFARSFSRRDGSDLDFASCCFFATL